MNDEFGALSLQKTKLELATVAAAVDYVTDHWRENFVICCLEDQEEFAAFMVRPFFMIIAIVAPVSSRFERCSLRTPQLTLETLIRRDDEDMYKKGLVHVMASARLTISNGDTLDSLRTVIDNGVFDGRWVRPDWDSYFMEMAELASHRSNCMKRRVGAVIVKDKRVVATGYNGTARGLTNCCDGGCLRCNSNARRGVALDHCYCLHAEENALLEAGRVRCEGATIYATTAPCLNCSQKIIQCGITRIVYDRDYSLAHNASDILSAVGIELVKFNRLVPSHIDTQCDVVYQ